MLRTGASRPTPNSFDRKAVPDDSFDDIPRDEDEDIVVSNIIQNHGSREGVDEAKQIAYIAIPIARVALSRHSTYGHVNYGQ